MIQISNRIKELWDLLIIILTLIAAIEIPYRIAFNDEVQGIYFIFEILLTVAFTTDILLNLFTPYQEHNRVISKPELIRKHYLKGWFGVDLIAALPFFLLPETIFGPYANTLRLLRAFQLIRLLKLSRVSHLVNNLQHRYGLNPGLYRLIFFIFFVWIAAHWIACGWIIIGGVEMSGSRAEIYSLAYYWSVTTLTTVGYGDITPSTVLQRYYTVLVMFAGVGSYGYIIGNIANLLANIDVLKASYRKKMDEVRAFLGYRKIPYELRRKVYDYYAHLWESRLGYSEDTVLNDIPEPLRTDLAIYMRRDLIKKVPFFSNCSDSLLRELVLILKPQVFLPKTFIMHKGEKGSCMYIVSSGSVEILTDDEQSTVAILSDGDFVGEMALILEQPRTASVRTVDYCDLYLLDKSQLDDVVKGYPEFRQLLNEIASRRLAERKKRQG